MRLSFCVVACSCAVRLLLISSFFHSELCNVSNCAFSGFTTVSNVDLLVSARKRAQGQARTPKLLLHEAITVVKNELSQVTFKKNKTFHSVTDNLLVAVFFKLQ